MPLNFDVKDWIMHLSKGSKMLKLDLLRDRARKKLTSKLKIPEGTEFIQIDTQSSESTDSFFIKKDLKFVGYSNAWGTQFGLVTGKIWNISRNILFYISLRGDMI